MRSESIWRRGLAAAATALGLSSAATAGSFQVSPINISVPHERPIGAVTVRNDSPDPVSLRVVTYRWTQQEGEDRYEAADDLVASPPIFTLPGNGTQLIRVGFRNPPAEGEAAYRVFLEEIPASSSASNGVKIALRLNLPLYKQPRTRGEARIRWSARPAGDRAIAIEPVNGGSLHEKLARIDWIDGAGRRQVLVEKPGVVLSGGSRRWWIDAAPEPAAGAIKLILVKTNGDEEAAQASLLDERLPIRIELGDSQDYAAARGN